jgi:hypothetical protein
MVQAHYFAPLYRRPSNVPIVSTNSLNISKLHLLPMMYVLWVLYDFHDKQRLSPTNTNQCGSEMDNRVFALKWELFYVI